MTTTVGFRWSAPATAQTTPKQETPPCAQPRASQNCPSKVPDTSIFTKVLLKIVLLSAGAISGLATAVTGGRHSAKNDNVKGMAEIEAEDEMPAIGSLPTADKVIKPQGTHNHRRNRTTNKRTSAYFFRIIIRRSGRPWNEEQFQERHVETRGQLGLLQTEPGH